MNASLIISRFNEDLSWLKKQNNFKTVIYNKGEEISNQKFKNIINLKNVGRESHTWLHHIVKNYYDLDDVFHVEQMYQIVFCNKHTHCFDTLKLFVSLILPPFPRL